MFYKMGCISRWLHPIKKHPDARFVSVFSGGFGKGFHLFLCHDPGFDLPVPFLQLFILIGKFLLPVLQILHSRLLFRNRRFQFLLFASLILEAIQTIDDALLILPQGKDSLLP